MCVFYRFCNLSSEPCGITVVRDVADRLLILGSGCQYYLLAGCWFDRLLQKHTALECEAVQNCPSRCGFALNSVMPSAGQLQSHLAPARRAASTTTGHGSSNHRSPLSDFGWFGSFVPVATEPFLLSALHNG